MTSIRTGPLPALVLAVLLAGGASASPVDLRPEVAKLAERIATQLKELGFQEIAVGEFTGPASWPVGGGRGIAEVLAQELKQRGLTVKKPPCKVAVKGEYEAVQDEDTRQLTAKITAVVKSSSGKELLSVAQPIEDVAKIAALLGVDVSFPPPKQKEGELPLADEKAQAEAVQKAKDRPNVHVEGGIVRNDARSPYGVEILVAPRSKAPPKPRPARKTEDGLAFVAMQADEVYAVRLINDSPLDAAVTLSIDGLSMFVPSEDKDPKTGVPKYSQVIVPRGQSVIVPGWHRTNKESREFLVKEFPESLAAALKSPGPVGVITASFAAAWPAGAPRPADEPLPPKDGRLATAAGAPVTAEYEEANVQTGAVRATVNVRYDRPDR
jgi:hypothetical protein